MHNEGEAAGKSVRLMLTQLQFLGGKKLVALFLGCDLISKKKKEKKNTIEGTITRVG